MDSFIATDSTKKLRPIYFIVVVWGERYTDYFLNFCIAALLSPNNIPALHNREKNKILISTTHEDWDAMQIRPIFNLLKQYLEPVLVAIPSCPDGLSSCVHMGIGHKLATEIAFKERAYAVLLTPDLILSDGTISAVQRRAVEGYHVVLTAAMRFGEEPLFENLNKLGVANIHSNFAKDGNPLIVSGRQLVWAGIRSFHSETIKYGFESDCFSDFPVACWWHVPEEDGVLVHCLSWAPLLVDYNAIERHDSSMLDNWTIDGDYIYKNFGNSENVYVCYDSDEMMLVSWAPMNDRPQSLSPRNILKNKFLGNFIRKLIIYETFNNKVFDPLKRKIFFKPVKWHSKDLNLTWNVIESKTKNILFSALGIHQKDKKVFKNKLNLYFYLFNKALFYSFRFFSNFIFRFIRIFNYYWAGKWRISKVLFDGLRGDPIARNRIKRNLLNLKLQLTGKSQ